MEPIMLPILQYGFAGFSLVLLGLLVWLVRQLIILQKHDTEVIAGNTQVVSGLTKAVESVLALQRETRDSIKAGRCQTPIVPISGGGGGGGR